MTFVSPPSPLFSFPSPPFPRSPPPFPHFYFYFYLITYDGTHRSINMQTQTISMFNISMFHGVLYHRAVYYECICRSHIHFWNYLVFGFSYPFSVIHYNRPFSYVVHLCFSTFSQDGSSPLYTALLSIFFSINKLTKK